ncbi:hypothetical protein KZX70_17270 [Paenibacillus silvae]|uniref:hypothetical protein n=1 Tax=Paenibacillus silvae TaxID=1325358 RepID=UPI001665F46C|nr:MULTISPECIES: hypothetical protein [Paenibacillus]MCK6076611.1 hypothetical protein [Paenibacillus silvae]MCK6151038.1 hypothetical protein [Paenibacillus silvae]
MEEKQRAPKGSLSGGTCLVRSQSVVTTETLAVLLAAIRVLQTSLTHPYASYIT